MIIKEQINLRSIFAFDSRCVPKKIRSFNLFAASEFFLCVEFEFGYEQGLVLSVFAVHKTFENSYN